MKKIIFSYGIIAGLITTAWWNISENFMPDSVLLSTRTWMGYASMVLAFSLIFVGIKQYRDNFNGGYITFGKAFKTGLYIALIASTFYVGVWLVVYYFFFPDFIQRFSHLQELQSRADGKSPAEVQQAVASLVKMGQLYKNPLFNILFTYGEILPVGLIMSLIAAGILKKKVLPVVVA